MVSDKPPLPQNTPAVVAKHVQVAFLRHRKRAKISTGNRHDLGSGNAKLQPKAARESNIYIYIYIYIFMYIYVSLWIYICTDTYMNMYAFNLSQAV